MFEWFSNNVDVIQAITAALNVILTIFLVAATIVLSRATVRSLAVMRETSEIAQKQFDLEWRPDLHLEVLPFDIGRNDASSPALRVTNLGRASVMVEKVRFRSASSVGGPSVEISVNRIIPGGNSEAIEFHTLKDALQNWFRLNQLTPGRPPETQWQEVQANVQLSLQIFSAGVRSESQWVTFGTQFKVDPRLDFRIDKIVP
jgi:hypothetical protein